MKNFISTLAVAFFLLAFAGFTSCNSPQDKVEDAQEDVNDAQAELEAANVEYLAEVEAYREEKARTIAANDSTIIAMRARMTTDKKNLKADYEQSLADLEQKNRAMKARMDDYRDGGRDNWESFKREFNRDMDELGSAFKNLTVNNKN